MKEIIEQILPLWGIENRQVVQIYPSAWEINHSYALKVYTDREQMERNIKISEILSDCSIPVAETVLTATGEKYVSHQDNFFFLSKKLPGSNISDLKDKTIAWEMVMQSHGCTGHLRSAKKKWSFGTTVF